MGELMLMMGMMMGMMGMMINNMDQSQENCEWNNNFHFFLVFE